jgi:hypothetical protein
MALVKLYSDVHLRPDCLILSVHDKNSVVTLVDLSWPKFLAGPKDGLKSCFPSPVDDDPALVESEQHTGVRS